MEHSAKEQTAATERAFRNRYIIMGIVLTGIFMSVLDGIVVSIALPTMTSHFHVDLASSQWITTAYLLTITSLLLICGKVSDFTGRVPMFAAGIGLFTLSSLACGFSTSLPMLVGFRVIQAVGGAMMFSISAAIIFQAFPADERGRAMGYIGSTVAVGRIVGPILGGFITEGLGWQYIFLINVPIGVILFLLALKFLRVHEHRAKHFRMDVPGAALLIITVVALVIFLNQLAGTASLTTFEYVLAAVFAVALAAFVYVERRTKEPLLDLSIFKVKLFVLPCVSMILYFIGNFMMNVCSPFYFQGVLGYTQSQVGMFMLVVPFIMVVGAPVGGWLYDKHHSRYYSTAGVGIVALGLFVMGYGAYVTSVPVLLLAMVLLGTGGALFQSPNNTEIMSSLPREKLSIASSVTATVRNLGFTLGVSLAAVSISLQFGSIEGIDFSTPGGILAENLHFINAITITIFIGGTIALCAAIASLLRNIGPRSVKGNVKSTPQHGDTMKK
ncbi:MAG: DHA2 family efflux MFS transporter permease subunit [Planctomycetaceae bacterium]|nr:MAG: DHA2 family efflux MFS transporter permease subunit [Planctomycetaceae bacterium]